ncbi:MAG: sulfatase-like hydrolase/transferase, partial [SAR202 cluster bacterium]|nr:sulfatase-like hydrolase/transferase [SAR202 cluster bacterium]
MKPRHTNVIVIVADDLGYGDIAAFGNPIVQTPNLDRMAAEGVTLTQHYSASPICAPARAALLTGRYNHRTGAVDVPSNRGLDRISLSETTVADLFKAAGYATGMVGKWHNGVHAIRYHPNARGFDEFAGFLNGGMDYWQWILDYNGTPKPADGRYLTDVFSDEAVEFVQRHHEEPFFLYLAYNAPHAPLQVPGEVLEHYQSVGLTPAVSAIYAMIERMDSGIGRLREALESL